MKRRIFGTQSDFHFSMPPVKKKKRLLLINPLNQHKKGLANRRESLQAPLGLGIVAALTPDTWDVRIIDENFRKFKYKEADLVGITALTAQSYRAYEIASVYRKEGIPTVLGGIHANMLPEEASNYVDTVVTGEAETIWPDVIRDFEQGTLKNRYHGPLSDLKNHPVPRYDLLHPGYIFGSVQTTRGCPMNCDFCSVPMLNHHTFRLRDINEVLDELEAIHNKLIYFVDDNLIGADKKSHEHAMALFQGMIDRKLNKEWFAYASLNVGNNEELVKLAKESGCRMMLIGIETEKPEQLKETNKRMNLQIGPENYHKVVKLLHKHGICVLGTFIVGIDSDTPEDVRNRITYMKKSPFDVTQGAVMTPFPGTQLYKRIKEENRILGNNFPENWQYYSGMDIVFHPKHMDPDQFAGLIRKLVPGLYSKRLIILKAIRTWWNTRSLHASLWAYQTNRNFRKLVLEKDITVISK